MKALSYSFPSVFETSFGNTENASGDLINGIKIKRDNNWYMVGNLAKRGGINPNRITNASPAGDDYDILFRSALLAVADKVQQPLSITLGFPLASYNVYKPAAEQFLNKRHFMVENDTKTFNVNGSVKRTMLDVERFEVIPEIVGCIIGLKKILEHQLPADFLAISLGFGTIEGGMVSKDGLINRTCFSSHGIQYAIDNLNRDLTKKYFLDLKNVHQLDDAFIKNNITVNRKRIDLSETRKEILTQYYKEVISPLIRKYIKDSDFENCEKIYLMGGGALYPEIQAAFEEEYRDFIAVEIAPEPKKLASIGYLHNSYRISDKNHARCAGIDIGNATTVVSIFQEVYASLSVKEPLNQEAH